jgi:hypothetical protein
VPAGPYCEGVGSVQAMHLHDPAGVHEPQQPLVIDARPGGMPVAAEQVERPPTQCLGPLRPSVVQEPAAVINELQPALWGHVVRWLRMIKPCQRLSPGPRRARLVLDKGRLASLGPSRSCRRLLVGIGPGLVRRRLRNAIFVADLCESCEGCETCVPFGVNFRRFRSFSQGTSSAARFRGTRADRTW